jgi:hypothetical protein
VIRHDLEENAALPEGPLEWVNFIMAPLEIGSEIEDTDVASLLLM